MTSNNEQIQALTKKEAQTRLKKYLRCDNLRVLCNIASPGKPSQIRAVMVLLEQHPSLASKPLCHIGGSSWYPLMGLLVYGGGNLLLEDLQRVYQMYPAAISTGTQIWPGNISYPLHFACESGSTEIIEFVAKEWPQAATLTSRGAFRPDEGLPIHLFISRNYQRGTTVLTNDQYYATIDMLLEIAPETLLYEHEYHPVRGSADSVVQMLIREGDKNCVEKCILPKLTTVKFDSFSWRGGFKRDVAALSVVLPLVKNFRYSAKDLYSPFGTHFAATAVSILTDELLRHPSTLQNIVLDWPRSLFQGSAALFQASAALFQGEALFQASTALFQGVAAGEELNRMSLQILRNLTALKSLTLSDINSADLDSLVSSGCIAGFIDILKHHNRSTCLIVSCVAIMECERKNKALLDELHFYSCMNKHGRIVPAVDQSPSQFLPDFVTRLNDLQADATPQLAGAKLSVLYELLRDTPAVWLPGATSSSSVAASPPDNSQSNGRKRKMED